jgi:glycosyltransferase involved in cell wall biosynthesis
MSTINDIKITVIVPVFNAKDCLLECLRALQNQTYPQQLTEILWIDNKSTDGSKEMLEGLGQIVVQEIERQGSYAARNKGIAASESEVVAFTDADCIPSAQWIEEGIKALIEQEADLVSGNVRFLLSTPPTGAELWDAVTNMQIAENIAQRGVSKTANLLVRREVFEKIGLFPADMQSGGDVLWTGRATEAGCKLIYHAPAEVAHPARRLWPLIGKQYRVGKGRALLYKAEKMPLGKRIWRVVLGLVPIRIRSVKRLLEQKGYNVTLQQVINTWSAAWLARIATAVGTLAGLVTPNPKRGEQ